MPRIPNASRREVITYIREFGEAGRALIARIADELGGDQCDFEKYASAKLEVLVTSLREKAFSDSDEPDHVDRLERMFDDLVVQQTVLAREKRMLEGEREGLELERKEHGLTRRARSLEAAFDVLKRGAGD